MYRKKRDGMRRLTSLVVLACCLIPTGCDEPGRQAKPDPPKPMSAPGEKWVLYTVMSYQSLEPTQAYNPWDKRSEIWEEYRLVLQSKTRGRLTVTCGQWWLPTGEEGCGQGVLLPNEKVWTRQGASGDNLWVYSSEHPRNGLNATLWHIDRRDAK